jgi:predicted ATPase
LVTLIGPGGVGKTRLVIEAARRLAGDFTDGARFVPLAAVWEPRDLASAIARALAAPVREGEPSRGALVRFLRNRYVLLASVGITT